MSYMRGYVYVYPSTDHDGEAVLLIHCDGHSVKLPMTHAHALALMLDARMEDEEREAAERLVIEDYGENIGAAAFMEARGLPSANTIMQAVIDDLDVSGLQREDDDEQAPRTSEAPTSPDSGAQAPS